MEKVIRLVRSFEKEVVIEEIVEVEEDNEHFIMIEPDVIYLKTIVVKNLTKE